MMSASDMLVVMVLAVVVVVVVVVMVAVEKLGGRERVTARSHLPQLASLVCLSETYGQRCF